MKSATSEDHQQRLTRVLAYIQENLDKPIRLDELAGIAAYSPFHFHRIFAAGIGESVGEHVRRLKLERAAHRLRHTRRSVMSIALEAGYDAPEAFARAFSACFHKTPTEFRRARQHARLPAANDIHFGKQPALKRLHASAEAACDLRIVPLKPFRIAFVRHVGPYEKCDTAYGKLLAWAGRRGLLENGPALLGIAYDDPHVTAPSMLRYEAAIVLGGNVPVRDPEVGEREMKAGTYARLRHCGPYETLYETYVRLCSACLARDIDLLPEPALEFYVNSPENAKPDDLITDVCMPIAAISR